MKKKEEFTKTDRKYHLDTLRQYWTSLLVFLSLCFLNGCHYVNQQDYVSKHQYDMMKNSLESKNNMTIIIAAVVCILVAGATLIAGNMMGSKSLEASRTHHKNEESDND